MSFWCFTFLPCLLVFFFNVYTCFIMFAGPFCVPMFFVCFLHLECLHILMISRHFGVYTSLVLTCLFDFYTFVMFTCPFNIYTYFRCLMCPFDISTYSWYSNFLSGTAYRKQCKSAYINLTFFQRGYFLPFSLCTCFTYESLSTSEAATGGVL